MDKQKVFVIMPFDDKFFEIYEMLKRQFEKDFLFSHAGEEDNQQNILKDIVQAIYDSDIIIANLTGLNPNVFYELGIAHTLNKKVIIITEDISTLPFDLKSYRAKEYSTHFVKFAELIDALNKYMYGAITGEVVYSNPVSDFLSTKSEKEVTASIYQKDATIALEEDTDKGFLDFLAGIEENAEEMTKNINKMAEDMNVMSSGMTTSTSEIERVNKTGGSGTTTFVRKEAKKVAKYIETFSTQLRSYNQIYVELWSKIEKDTLGLIENKFAAQNKENLVSYLKSLKSMQMAIEESCSSVEDMKKTSLNNLGMERTLNQAIRFLDEDLANYIGIMGQIISSIDRILEKSRFVVGEITVEEV